MLSALRAGDLPLDAGPTSRGLIEFILNLYLLNIFRCFIFIVFAIFQILLLIKNRVVLLSFNRLVVIPGHGSGQLALGFVPRLEVGLGESYGRILSWHFFLSVGRVDGHHLNLRF